MSAQEMLFCEGIPPFLSRQARAYRRCLAAGHAMHRKQSCRGMNMSLGKELRQCPIGEERPDNHIVSKEEKTS